MSLRLLLVFAAVLSASAASAEPYRLAPHKDDLFKYPAILDTQDNGDFVVVGYDKARDLHKRDEVPERRVWPNYVSTVSLGTGTFIVDGVTLKFIGAGRLEGGASAVVIYVHGQGGTRYQGADQWMFGGNFNRIMNLMVQNNGAYLSPDFSDLGAKGAGEVKALLLDQVKRSPSAAIFVACGSQGGAICWRLAADAKVAPHLAGLLMLGSTHDDAFLKSPAVKAKGWRIPLYLGHGTLDPIFPWQDEVAFYRKVRKAAPGYPIRVALFDTGVHGTPIRMTDWRLVLNWMLEAGGR